MLRIVSACLLTLLLMSEAVNAETVQELLRKADKNFESKDYRNAALMYLDAYEGAELTSEISYALGGLTTALRVMGEFKQALGVAKELLKQFPDNIWASTQIRELEVELLRVQQAPSVANGITEPHSLRPVSKTLKRQRKKLEIYQSLFDTFSDIRTGFRLFASCSTGGLLHLTQPDSNNQNDLFGYYYTDDAIKPVSLTYATTVPWTKQSSTSKVWKISQMPASCKDEIPSASRSSSRDTQLGEFVEISFNDYGVINSSSRYRVTSRSDHLNRQYYNKDFSRIKFTAMAYAVGTGAMGDLVADVFPSKTGAFFVRTTGEIQRNNAKGIKYCSTHIAKSVLKNFSQLNQDVKKALFPEHHNEEWYEYQNCNEDVDFRIRWVGEKPKTEYNLHASMEQYKLEYLQGLKRSIILYTQSQSAEQAVYDSETGLTVVVPAIHLQNDKPVSVVCFTGDPISGSAKSFGRLVVAELGASTLKHVKQSDLESAFFEDRCSAIAAKTSEVKATLETMRANDFEPYVVALLKSNGVTRAINTDVSWDQVDEDAKAERKRYDEYLERREQAEAAASDCRADKGCSCRAARREARSECRHQYSFLARAKAASGGKLHYLLVESTLQRCRQLQSVSESICGK